MPKKRHKVGAGFKRRWIVLAKKQTHTDLGVPGVRGPRGDTHSATATVWYGPKSAQSADPSEPQRAQRYALGDPGTVVFVYPAEEKDPLGRARREVLK